MEEAKKEERILPEFTDPSDASKMMELVYIALGAASTSWEPMDCTGVFMSERANQLGSELMQAINAYAQAHVLNDEFPELVDTPDTMQKVYRGLKHAELTERQILNAVHAMQNEGVIFREVNTDGDEEVV